MIAHIDADPSICFEVSVKEFDGALHGQAEIIREVVIIPFIYIKLRDLIGFQHFVIEHL